MKKSSNFLHRVCKSGLTLCLAAGMMLCFAACSDDTNSGNSGNEEWVATPSDLLDPEVDPVDPTQTADNEVYVENYAEAAALLGLEGFDFHDDMKISRILIVDEIRVQIEFAIGELKYIAFMTTGLQENMSGLSKGFETSETVTIGSQSVQLRYTEANSNTNVEASRQGVADGYDSALNISYSLVSQQFNEGTLADFNTAAEMFVLSIF